MALPNPITRILIANRGEIAVRLISAALDLSLHPIALYTAQDSGHAQSAPEAHQLASPASYTDAAAIVSLAVRARADAIHPGYGFLSEDPRLARLAARSGVRVVGPHEDVLRVTADKVAARAVAQRCGVPVLPAMEEVVTAEGAGAGAGERGTAAVTAAVAEFAKRVGFPVMIKAVDGGGGRGIRLVRGEGDLETAVRRAVEESPSRKVYAEKAAVDGVLHVEVQVVGDGNGHVVAIGERQCSIQRRWQKVVEVGPCVNVDRKLVRKVVNSAVDMAREIKYTSLGTFEFLVQPNTGQFYFLEVNPRLQVEHTVTEMVADIDLVRAQLLIAQGASLEQAGIISSRIPNILSVPQRYACQLRVTAEDVSKDWTLSIGKLSKVVLPGGNGVRVDHAIEPEYTIGSSFDSLLAKIIVVGHSWDEVVRKCQRAINQTIIEGVKTNIPAIRGIVKHPDFLQGDCDTRWLERKQSEILQLGNQLTPKANLPSLSQNDSTQSSIAPLASGPPLFRKGDAWEVILAPIDEPEEKATRNHLILTSIAKNDFPSSLISELEFTTPSGDTMEYKLTLTNTTSSANAVTSQHRRGDLNNPRHVVIPIPGKLVEFLVDEGDFVKPEDVICVIQQMKMEIEIRAKTGGKVVWVTEVEDGEEISEGLLAAEIEPTESSKL